MEQPAQNAPLAPVVLASIRLRSSVDRRQPPETSPLFPGIYKRGAVYWFRWRVDGKRLFRSLQTTRADVAVAKAMSLRARPPVAPGGKWAAEVKAWLRGRRDEGRISRSYAASREYALLSQGRLMDWTRPADVTPGKVEAWYQLIRSTHSAATAATYLTALRAFLAWQVRGGKLDENAADGIHPPPSQPMARGTFLRADIVRSLIEGAPRPDLRLALILGFWCGLRRGEICHARAEWIDLRAGSVRVTIRKPGTEGKSDPGWLPKWRKERVTVLPLEAAAWVGEFFPQRTGFLLHPERPNSNSPIRWDFRVPFALYLSASGFPDTTIHDMRRSFASNKAIAGVSLYKVATWLGDGINVTTRHYAHLSPNDADRERGI